MYTIRHEIASAATAYQKALDSRDMNKVVAASTRLYEVLGRPLGANLAWVWFQFETWTTTN